MIQSRAQKAGVSVEVLEMGVVITSENNFNTASGLASSASGLSCLAVALCEAY
jgi:mevalonate pyrophosphate decarboxylase